MLRTVSLPHYFKYAFKSAMKKKITLDTEYKSRKFLVERISLSLSQDIRFYDDRTYFFTVKTNDLLHDLLHKFYTKLKQYKNEKLNVSLLLGGFSTRENTFNFVITDDINDFKNIEKSICSKYSLLYIGIVTTDNFSLFNIIQNVYRNEIYLLNRDEEKLPLRLIKDNIKVIRGFACFEKEASVKNFPDNSIKFFPLLFFDDKIYSEILFDNNKDDKNDIIQNYKKYFGKNISRINGKYDLFTIFGRKHGMYETFMDDLMHKTEEDRIFPGETVKIEHLTMSNDTIKIIKFLKQNISKSMNLQWFKKSSLYYIKYATIADSQMTDVIRTDFDNSEDYTAKDYMNYMNRFAYFTVLISPDILENEEKKNKAANVIKKRYLQYYYSPDNFFIKSKFLDMKKNFYKK
jgi:hypothetical protein